MAATRRTESAPLCAYVALLRGINVGGKNIISMKALAATFERIGLTGVRTYIQSGNVVFQSPEDDPRALETRIQAALRKAHRYTDKVVVRTRAEMQELARRLPRSWKKPDAATRYYVLFLRHGIDSKHALQGIRPKPEIEEISYRPGAVLWSASVPHIGRSGVAKLVSMPIYKEMTIRNLNTTLKLCALLDAVSSAGEIR